MPSIKKRVTGFIRQLSAPNGGGGGGGGGGGSGQHRLGGENGGPGHHQVKGTKSHPGPHKSKSPNPATVLDSEGFIQKYLQK